MTMRKSSKSLDLWMNGHQVGQWSIEAGVDVLQYDIFAGLQQAAMRLAESQP